MMVLLTAIALLCVGLLVFWIEPLGALSVRERLTPNVTYRVRTHRPLVALPSMMVHTLTSHSKSSRFSSSTTLRQPSSLSASGPCATRRWFLVSKVMDTRSVTTTSLNASILCHSDADFLCYLEQTERAIGITAGPKLFRPPGGVAWPRQLRLARAHRYECVLGSAYPHDPMHPPLSYIRWLIRKNLVPGAIVILHDGMSDPTRSIQALPQILTAGHQSGLRFVSIGALVRGAAEQMETFSR